MIETTYTFSFYVKGAGTPVNGSYGDFTYNYGDKGSVTLASFNPTSVYQEVTASYTAKSTSGSINLFGSNVPLGDHIYVDDVSLTPNAPAPEPSSVAAFAFTGLFAAGLMLRARKRKANA